MFVHRRSSVKFPTTGQMGPLVGSIDEGTSSARFILFKAGTTQVVAQHQEELKQIFPKEGWVEQSPIEILEAVNKCIDKTLRKLEELGGSAEDIKAIGITNQRESTIVWDKNTGNTFCSAITIQRQLL